jgi:hypothetical protein
VAVEGIEEFKRAIEHPDAAGLRRVLGADPAVKARIDDPLFSFDSPAIRQCAANGDRELVDILLDHGADIHARSSWWAGSFGVLDHDNREMAQYLIGRGARVDAHAAARHNLIGRLREILDADASAVHARGGDGQTPLHVAGSLEAAQLLVERGADINARDIDHESTPAQYLVSKHQDVVRYLIARGCDTDILLAAAVGDTELVRRHLDRNPESIRKRVTAEHFPMRDARAGGSIYIWTLGQNESPHRVARRFGHADTLALLMERSPEDLRLVEGALAGDAALVAELQKRDPERVRELARINADYISDAAQGNETAVVKLMLECGWPVEGDRKHTPLHWAAWHGNTKMVGEILRFHPPLEFPDADFQGTPLGWAIHGSMNSWHHKTGDYGGTVKALLAAGAARPAEIGGTAAVQEALRG